MSEMSVQEAYRVLQANCGIGKGDKVEVVRAPFLYDGVNSYPDHWRKRVGNVYRIDNIESTTGWFGFSHEGRNFYDGCYTIPFYCLELVEKAKPELPPILVGGNEVKFIRGDIPRIEVCGVSVHKETLRKILERLDEN